MLGRELILDDVIQILKSMGYENRGMISSKAENAEIGWKGWKRKVKEDEFDAMVEKIASYYGLEKDEIIWESRRKEVAVARQMCMTIAKKQFGRTLEKIGWYFHKNHSSVIYSLDKFEELLRDDETVKEDWRELGMS